MGHPVLWLLRGVQALAGLLGYEVDLAEEAGGDGLDLVEVLHLEAVAVFGDEGFVVVGWEGGRGIDGGVVDADLDVVLGGFELAGDLELVGWVPGGADALAVNEDDGGFADGWVVPGAHSGAGVPPSTWR